MKYPEKEKQGVGDLPNFEDEVTARIEGDGEESAEIPVVPASPITLEDTVTDAPSAELLTEDAPDRALAPSAEPVPETIVSDAAEETPATVEDRPEPQYGAPQPLFEDIIPAGFARDEERRKEAEERAAKVAAEAAAREEKEAEAARKKAEKEASKEAKKQAKEEKKRAKTAALIAKVEAEAEQKAKKEIEKETGEPYELPAKVADRPADDVAAAVGPEMPAPAEASPEASSESTSAAQQAAPVRQYSSYERKLRKKYKIDKDPLLSDHAAVPGFVIAKGERVIRSYECLSTGKGDGILCLTNKRLLINAGERAEIGIDRVSGIKFGKYAHFSPLKFVFWLIFFGLGVFMLLLPSLHAEMNIPFLAGDNWKSWFTYLFYACGGVSVVISLPLFFTMLKKTFYFCVFAREEAPFLEYKNPSYAKRERKGKVYKYMIGKSGRESEKAARELGALIIEAKEGRYDE